MRIIDKLCRLTRGNGEGGEDAWADIAGYGLLGMRHREQVEAVERMNTIDRERHIAAAAASNKGDEILSNLWARLGITVEKGVEK